MERQLRALEERLQRQWETCRLGLQRCRRDERDRDRLLDWLRKDRSDPLSALWTEILLGKRPDLECVLLEHPHFPRGRGDDGLLRQLATSSPFPLLRDPVGRR
jgi:hypothetical protein